MHEIKQTWDDQRLKRDRIARAREQMKKKGIGAMYLCDNAVTGRYLLAQKVPGGELFVPPEGEVLAFIRGRDQGYVKMHHSNVQEPLYRRDAARDGTSADEVKRFGTVIADLMAKYGLAGEVLGVDRLSSSLILSLNDAGIRLADAAPVIEHAGAVKTQDELEIYRIIGDQYYHTVSAFRDAIRPGISENELASIVVSAWYEAGGEDIAQLNVCSGENMNPWRRWPTQRKIKEGEFVGLDLHGRGIHGLRGDGSRTFFVGDKPSVEQRDLYKRAYNYLMNTIDIFQSGRSFAEVLERQPDVPDKYAVHLDNYNIGHGMGLGSSGYPHITKKKAQADAYLEPNQVIAVECYMGEVGSNQAVKLEEIIVVREGKPEILRPGIPYDERLLD
jgi:Xaa-Pro aminopeptidase